MEDDLFVHSLLWDHGDVEKMLLIRRLTVPL